MKTKTFLLICLFLGIGLTRLSAQNGNKGTTGTSPNWTTWEDYSTAAFLPNGEWIDILAGPVTIHFEDHYQNGVWIWRDAYYSGYVTSVGYTDANGNKVGGTDEVFKINDHWKWDVQSDNYGFGHFNAVGDKGTHYIIFYQVTPEWGIGFVKAVGTGNGN
jgi:hypothetical protein